MANISVPKFCVCVIVHGPPQIGRTTISQENSKYIRNVLIVSVKELWKTLRAEVSPAFYVALFKEAIGHGKYDQGFVVDGLNSFPEGNDSEAFLVHDMKRKDTLDELQKNPLVCLQYDKSTASEKTLSYILASLNGHYVFQVALNAIEPVLQQRKAASDNEERARNIAEHKKEMDSLFNVTEDEYNALTEEEQRAIDKKREYLRSFLLRNTSEFVELNRDDRSSI